MKHTHRALPEKTADGAWTVCIAPRTCTHQASHGGFSRHEECGCGATRTSEINGAHETVGKWSGGNPNYRDHQDYRNL